LAGLNKKLIYRTDSAWSLSRLFVIGLILLLINNSACLGHLHRQASPRESAAQRSREIWLQCLGWFRNPDFSTSGHFVALRSIKTKAHNLIIIVIRCNVCHGSADRKSLLRPVRFLSGGLRKQPSVVIFPEIFALRCVRSPSLRPVVYPCNAAR
jgi:hypothetical protein